MAKKTENQLVHIYNQNLNFNTLLARGERNKTDTEEE